jgi:hypothetical protein
MYYRSMQCKQCKQCKIARTSSPSDTPAALASASTCRSPTMTQESIRPRGGGSTDTFVWQRIHEKAKARRK